MGKAQKILKAQWKNTPLWTKVLASAFLIWSVFYFVDAALIFLGQNSLAITGQTFEAYTLVLKILVGVQLILLVIHIIDIFNQKTVMNPNIQNGSKQMRLYVRKIHPLLGMSVITMALAHSLWNFAQFFTFSWPWSVQIISGIGGIILLILIAVSGDGILFAPAQRRQKIILIHTIIVLIFLIPFFIHI
ncbi:MAG: hypothetical protein ACRCWD_08570 [Culicoidibacterales bacterium]